MYRFLRDRCFYFAGKQGKDGPEEKKDADGELWGNVEAQAAFLGPNLWDKTLPYDADLKVLNHVCIKTRYGKLTTWLNMDPKFQNKTRGSKDICNQIRSFLIIFL